MCLLLDLVFDWPEIAELMPEVRLCAWPGHIEVKQAGPCPSGSQREKVPSTGAGVSHGRGRTVEDWWLGVRRDLQMKLVKLGDIFGVHGKEELGINFQTFRITTCPEDSGLWYSHNRCDE